MWCPVHTSTASKTATSCFPSLSVTTSHWPVAAKSGRLDTRHTLVWVQGERASGTLCPGPVLLLTPDPGGSHPESDVAEQVEVLGVHAEVLHDLGVVHVVGEVLRYEEVAEAHHLLGGVDDDRAVDAGAALLGVLLQEWGMALCGQAP